MPQYLTLPTHFCRMSAASPEILLEAFQVLDPDGKGYVTKDYLSTLMMDEGEPFTQVFILIWTALFQLLTFWHFKEELDEMMASAVDAPSGQIPYEYYINSLMVL